LELKDVQGNNILIKATLNGGNDLQNGGELEY